MGIDEDWHEFARAFAEAARPDDTQGRYTKRVLIIGFSAVLAASLSAVVYGSLTARGSAGGPNSPVATITPGPGAVGGFTPGGFTPGGSIAGGQAGSTWTAVAGPTCSNGAARFAMSGYYTRTSNGQATGWITSSGGGYTNDGCAGGFMSVPLSGQPNVYDTNRYALWTFRLTAQFTGATCDLSTFIPDSPQRAYVGGNPAYYLYYGTAYSAVAKAQPLGGYSIDQVSMRGDWVAGGSLKVRTGWVTVKMVDAGANTTPATGNAHAAAAQMRLTCHAAS
jgi:hypothetical protein